MQVKGATKAIVLKPQQTEDNGEERKGGGSTKTKLSKKKSPSKGSDDETSCKSKRAKLDDKVSVFGGKRLDSLVANLEAMKGLLRKTGAGKVKPTEAEKKKLRSQQLLRCQQARELPVSWKLLSNTTNV